MVGIDFNLHINFGQKTFAVPMKGLADAFRSDRFLAADGLSSQKSIRQMCSQILRQSSNKNFFLFRPISLYGFCTDNLSTESSRHRNLSEGNEAKTLPFRNPRERLSQYVGKCKRTSRLENLRRLCSDFDRQGTKTLCQRRLRQPAEQGSLCP